MAATPVRVADASSPHDESVELVAVGVAKIARVKAFAARTGGAFVAAAMRQRDIIEALDLIGVAGLQRHHHAIADGRDVAVERLGQADARAAPPPCPRR